MNRRHTTDWQTSQTITTNMFRKSNTPGDSDTRHSTCEPNNQYYKLLATSHEAIDQSGSSPCNQNHNKLHLDVTLNGTTKIKALIDSGSAICVANSSILSYLAIKSTKGPPITLTNCHNHREKTQNYYKATINVDKDLPYPIKNKRVNIHVIDNLPSKLILGTDFLRGSGEAINFKKNTPMSPEGKEIIARYTNPIPQETTTTTWEGNTPKKNLKGLRPRFITNIPRASKLGTADNTTLGITPTPGIYNNPYPREENDTLQTIAMNADIHPTKSYKKRYIVGGHGHQHGDENIMGLTIPKTHSRILSLIHKEQTNKHNPVQHKITLEEHPDVRENILWSYTLQPKEPNFDDPDRNKKPTQDTQTKITKNQLEHFDTKDVEQGWNQAYQQTITNQPTYTREHENQVLDVRSMGEIATNLKFSHNRIEQLTTYNTPIFMVAIRNGPNVEQKRFIRDFRDRNIPDYKLSWNTGEASRKATTHPLAINYGSILHNPARETSTETPTPLTLPLKNGQGIWPHLPKTQEVISYSPNEQYRTTFQNIQIIKGNYIIAGGLLSGGAIHVTRNREPIIGPGRRTLTRPHPTDLTQREHTSTPSTQDDELALYQPLARKEHIIKSLETNRTQSSVESSEGPSPQEIKQQRRTPATSGVNNPTRIYCQPLSTMFRGPSIHGSMENPITPNQENTPATINTFARYPRMMENPNRETVTLTKTLLDQWMVRHGSYEQSNDPPYDQNSNIDTQAPGTHTTNWETTRSFFQTTEKRPHARAIEYYKSETPSIRRKTKH